MSKVLWLGDGGCRTGFARVTHAIGERLVRDFGHEVHVLATNYKGDPWPSSLDPSQQSPLYLYVPTIGAPDDTYGRRRIQEMLLSVEPDVVVILNDPTIVMKLLASNPWDTEHLLLRYRPVLAYMPVDGFDLPRSLTTVLPQVVNVIAMSKFGQKSFEPSRMVYHGVDTELFRPAAVRPLVSSLGHTVTDKASARVALADLVSAGHGQRIEYPEDAFLVFRADSNSGRKDWGAFMRALAPVMARHDDIIVHMHTHTGKTSAGGVELMAVADRFPDVATDRWRYPAMPPGVLWPDEDLVIALNAADLVVDTSRGEGFGFGPAEALACEVPVIAQAVTAITEVVGPGGVLVPESGVRVTVPAGHDLAMPDVRAFTNEIEYLYRHPAKRANLGKAGREHVQRSFSWAYATQKFDEYIRAAAAHVSKEPEDEHAGGGP